MTNHKPSLADLISMPLLIVVRNKNMKSEQYVIIAIVLGSTIAPIGAGMAFGQELSEMDRLNGLYTTMSEYGYTEVADLNNEGSIIEFRSNGTVHLAEDTAGFMITGFGFTMMDYSPAPIGQDSIIVVATVNGASD